MGRQLRAKKAIEQGRTYIAPAAVVGHLHKGEMLRAYPDMHQQIQCLVERRSTSIRCEEQIAIINAKQQNRTGVILCAGSIFIFCIIIQRFDIPAFEHFSNGFFGGCCHPPENFSQKTVSSRLRGALKVRQQAFVVFTSGAQNEE
ncbi:MAG: hypothetical protein KatS3mg015_3133 [Fimbriimonadales bacterium]|nr:MAG: hypothetical protein KatS3mg015_3133 [Fimbriimonadales bacterium]